VVLISIVFSQQDLHCVKAETDGDNETGAVSADSSGLIDVKEEMGPVLTFAAVKSESQASHVFIVINI
jgi:hypothetical protein